MVYVPSTYTGSKKVPLVLVMHGYTASMYAIAEESRWYDVAEQNGFIVVFAQGLVRPADLMGNIPTAMWLAGPFAALAGKDTDPAWIWSSSTVCWTAWSGITASTPPACMLPVTPTAA